MSNRRANRDDRGAVAVLVAICSVLIFSLAALAVDLGNAFNRKRDIQTQADLAALSAAEKLPDQAAVKAALNTYSLENFITGQDAATWDFDDTTDDYKENGWVTFPHEYMLRLWAPKAKVDFGLAGLLDPDLTSADVSAVAAVEIQSPGEALPVYVADSCSWGQQTILDNSNGLNTPTFTPASSSSNNLSFTVSPSDTPLGTAVTLTVTADGGTNLDNVNKVGFTTDGGLYPHVEVLPPFASKSSTVITVDVPPAVYNSEALWYVRLHTDAKGWSKVANAQTFTVGDPVLVCDGSESGNFGTLKLSREDSPSAEWDNRNIVEGIERSLDVYPVSPAPTFCGGLLEAVEDPYARVAFTEAVNCLRTDTGLPANAATEGFIGKGGVPGRLARVETTEGCDPSGTSEEYELRNLDGNHDYYINNDVLSCFFLDDTTTVASVTQEVGAPEHVISADIFDSPRFFWLPVVTVDPSAGTSARYPIITFRPTFLSGQPLSATRATPGGVTDNGLVIENDGIREVKAIMINMDSMPESAPAVQEGIRYIGTGTRIYRLVE